MRHRIFITHVLEVKSCPSKAKLIFKTIIMIVNPYGKVRILGKILDQEIENL